jgi:Concanavalin A-like lectin/glucanases superfamily/Chitobiase/beta-hexosaminidase C-terminal domain/Family of unknown function (DUF6298)/Putative collagen-binding domain of a collagenase
MPQVLFSSERLPQTRVNVSRFALALLSWVVFVICFLSPAKAAGPLSVGSGSSRFFIDSNGKAVYLTGAHVNNNLVDRSDKAILDFTRYLDFLQEYRHNFVRLWAWEQAAWTNESSAKITFDPLPYRRTGSGRALDGRRKFDLSRFNQAYFDRLRSRVVEAGERGLYVSVMLFQGFSSQRKNIGSGNPWTGHPFNLSNNINGINGDPSGNDNGEEVHSLTVPAITSLQETYVRKVVDTLNDLDNVLYEISGDAPVSTKEWQYYMIDYLKSYEATKPKQHPVGMSSLYLGSADDLLASPADWISLIGTDTNPQLAANHKVIFSDIDPKLLTSGTSYQLVWKHFMRGFNPIYLESDLTDPSVDGNVRNSMGYTLQYSQLVDLSSMVPSSESCSSGFCLINPGREYLVYLPLGGTVNVDLSAASGSFVASWFSPTTGQTKSGGTVSAGSPVLFTSPIHGDAVLYLQAMPALSNQSADTSVGLSSSDTALTTAATQGLSLSNTGPVTVTQGSSVTTTINATLSASRKRSISFSVSGLPQGVSAAFSPNSCTPDCSTQLKLTASTSAAVGNYTITVTGKNRWYQATTSFTLSIAQLPAAVNAPTITPNGGTFTNSVTVALQTSTAEASIYYTTDGTTPTQSSKLYGAPFVLTATSLVKAQAFKSGMTPSPQVSAWFTKETSPVITPGLVAAFGFNEGTGTTVTDVSGNNNNGTISGATWTTQGRYGAALGFDGANDWITINDAPSLDLTTGLTLEAWVFPAATQTGWRTVVQKEQPNGTTYYLHANSEMNAPATGVFVGNEQQLSGSSPLPENTWTHLAATYDGSQMRLYVNGVQVAARSQSGVVATSTGALRIGGNSVWGEYFIGWIDEVRIYNRSLSLAEIQQDMITAIGSGGTPSSPPPTFNFSVSNSGNVAVTQGQSVSNTVTASISSGSSQAVSFSNSGLPSGATASYASSTSCNPTCSRTLNINTTGSTPTGTYTITVTGTGGGVTKTTNFSLTVNPSTVTTVATPTINPNGGSFSGSVSVALQTATSAASIYYTTDGSTPTQSSALYTGPMTLTSSATVKAIAFKSGSNSSAVASAAFAIVAAPPQLTLMWQDNSTNESNFRVERKTGTSGTYAQIALVAADTTSYVDTSVTSGGTYCYRVNAINSGGASIYTNEACATVPYSVVMQ